MYVHIPAELADDLDRIWFLIAVSVDDTTCCTSMTRRKNKTPRPPRGCRGLSSFSASISHANNDILYDLDVPLVIVKNSTGAIDASLFWNYHQPILQRLYSTGYSVVALSHTVYGKIDLQRDSASNRFPAQLTFPRLTSNATTNFKILKRLNVVLEQVSDLDVYSLPLSSSDSSAAKSSTVTTTSTNTNNSPNPYHEFLKEYDIIAMSARNDTVFSTICSTAHLLWVDIITLDYTAGRGGVQLPFSLKPSLVSSATSQGLYFDIPYSPAIMDPNKRKAFVQVAKQFQMAIMAKTSSSTLPLILCSGSRRRTNPSQEDVGPMALRQPGDLQNFCQVVLGFQGPMAGKLMRHNAEKAVERGLGWKIYPSLKIKARKSLNHQLTYQVSFVKLEEQGNDAMNKRKNGTDEDTMEAIKKPKRMDSVDGDADDLDDGFLRLS